MTKAEEILELQSRIERLKCEIEENGNREKFLDNAVGKYISFIFEGYRRYMYVLKRNGKMLEGNSFTESTVGIEMMSSDYYTFDDSITKCEILTKNDVMFLMRKEFESWLDNMEY